MHFSLQDSDEHSTRGQQRGHHEHAAEYALVIPITREEHDATGTGWAGGHIIPVGIPKEATQSSNIPLLPHTPHRLQGPGSPPYFSPGLNIASMSAFFVPAILLSVGFNAAPSPPAVPA